MIRLFTALSLPDDLRARLGLISCGIRGARWVHEGSLHVTLRYIGSVGEDRLHDIVEALRSVDNLAPVVELTGVGHFGGDRPRVVWIGVRKTQELIALRDKIDRRLIRYGLEPEHRKYTPHITIARLGNVSKRDVRSWLETNGAFAAFPFTAPAFVLYESLSGRSGSTYVPLAEFSLGAD